MDTPYAFEPNLVGLLSLILTVVLPLLVGLITRKSTNAGVKSVLLLLGSGVASVLQVWLAAASSHIHFVWFAVVYNAVVNFAIAVAIHFGLWKPTGVAEAAQNTLNKD